MADVEDEAEGYQYPYQYGEEQGQTVAVALCPELLPLFRVVLLHDHSTQEGRNEHHRQQPRDGIGIPVECPSRQQLLHER